MDSGMTFNEALVKRNEARDIRKKFIVNDETSIGLLSAEYNWGFWDAVITIMKHCGINELDEKAVQW
jgi:hypothetical protein